MMSFVIFIYSFIIRFVCSYNSPIFDDSSIASDNAVFYMIGKALMEGKVLYKEAFDHKPPYIYFLNALCSIISYRHIGLFIADVIFTFLFFYFLYKILKLFIDNKLLIIVSLIFTALYYNFGAISEGICRTETISLAFLMILSYIFFKYIVDIDRYGYKEFSIYNMFFIGILSGTMFMFNIKAPTIIMPFAFSVAYILIKNKLYKNLLFVFCSGLLGVIISIIPYLIYMIKTDSTSDMIHTLFDVNIIYSNPASNINTTYKNILSSILSWPSAYRPFFILLIAILIVMIFIKYNKMLKFIFILSLTMLIFYTFIVNRKNPYYLQMFAPYISVLIVLLFHNFIDINKYLTKPIVIICFIVSFLLNLYYGSINILYNSNYRYKFFNTELNNILKKENLDRKNLKVLSFGFNPEIYIYLNAKYSFKYQITPVIKYESYSEGYDEQLSYVQEALPDVIVFKKDKYMLQFNMEHYNKYLLALAKSYHPIGKVEDDKEKIPYVVFIKNK